MGRAGLISEVCRGVRSTLLLLFALSSTPIILSTANWDSHTIMSSRFALASRLRPASRAWLYYCARVNSRITTKAVVAGLLAEDAAVKLFLLFRKSM